MSACETCGRRAGHRKGDLISTDANGNVTAWCAEHARHRPPWFGRAGWPWMRELDRLWAKADEAELADLLKNGGRDLVFDRQPPLREGEVRHIGRLEVRVIWVRQSKPGRWTVRVRRKVPERVLMLRTGSLPYRSDKPGRVRAPTPDEVEQAGVESAYVSYRDELDAGQAVPREQIADFARRARLRRATEISEELTGEDAA